MQFEQFAAAHGLIVERVDAGRWVRVPTVDHPRTRNGAYKYLGDIAWVQNHATMPEVAVWRTDAPVKPIDMARINAEAARFVQRQRDAYGKAARVAADMLASAKQGEHGYLQIKGLGDQPGLVLPDEALMVPMRHWRTNSLVGAQVIRWLPDERRYEKKMLHGMRAKGAVLRLGSPQAARTWLVEGYSTGLSVEAAVRLTRLRDAVLVCFSAGNLAHVAGELAGKRMAVFADNDESGTGERTARATGLPFCMSTVAGEDANDLHQRAGVFAVASAMRAARLPQAP